VGIQFVSGPLRGMSAWFNKKRQKPNPVDASEELPVGDGNKTREQSDYSQKKSGEAETYDAAGHVHKTDDDHPTLDEYG